VEAPDLERTWRGKTTPIATRMHQDGLLLQRLYFADEVHNAAEIERGAAPKIRDQERTLAERLINELSETEFHPENYEDEYRKQLLKAIAEENAFGQACERTARTWKSVALQYSHLKRC
jgi:DNA end-binding protein Ku